MTAGDHGRKAAKFCGGRIMSTTVSDDMFTPDVIANPYAYYGKLREEDPVHWNET